MFCLYLIEYYPASAVSRPRCYAAAAPWPAGGVKIQYRTSLTGYGVKLAGFLSYAHEDDLDEAGRITRLRERLERSVRRHAGVRDFTIFQDKDGIDWGRDWQEVLDNSLDAVVLFFPVLSPLWFASPNCRDELAKFRARQTALGRNDLILPIYYLRSDLMDGDDPHADPAEVEAATLLKKTQFAPWHAHRRLTETDPAYNAAIEGLAERAAPLVRQLRRLAIGSPVPAAPAAVAPPPVIVPPPAPPATARDTAMASVVELVVDQLGRGDHMTITEALRNAPVGARVLIRPGLYRENLVISKPVELVGDGERDLIVVEGVTEHTILFEATAGIIRGLTLRQRATHKYCVWATDGRLTIEDCDVSSDGLACIAVSGTGDPHIRRNRVHDGKASGIVVYASGRGTIEDNDIFANILSGIEVKQQGDPMIRKNKVHDGKSAGIIVYEGGRGTIEDNDIFANTAAGIEVREQGDPMVRKNKIHDGKSSGIHVHTDGHGTISDNDIFANGHAGIRTRTGATPTVRGNRITENIYEAIWITDSSGGTYEDNDLRGNTFGAWDIDETSLPLVKRARNQEK